MTERTTEDGARIDVHFHDIPDFYRAAAADAGRGPALSSGLPPWSPELALGLMDRHGIATAILSITAPGVHFGDVAPARTLARRCNAFAAECAQRWPGRFGGFAVLPLPDVTGSLLEIDHALDVLGLDGIGLYTSYGDAYLGDAEFDPILAQLDERAAVAFVHPVPTPSMRALRLDMPPFVLEYTFETTRAAANLIFRGALDRFPKVRFILSHAGGTLPYLAFRLAQSTLIDPTRLGHFTPDDVLARIRRFWFDTALSPLAATSTGTLSSVADADRVLFGSDWPFAPEASTASTIAALAAPGALSDASRAKIERTNALALFPRLATRSPAPS